MSVTERAAWEVGGATLSGLVAGEASGGAAGVEHPTIVLLHGIPASAELWRDVLPHLAAAGHHVVALDLPGYGHTRLPARADHSLAGAAELVATWLRVHVGRAVWVVGHDLGGAVAQILAARHPTLLERLTLADTVYADSWPVTPIALLSRIARAGLYPTLVAARLFPNPYSTAQVRRGFHDPAKVGDDLLDRVFWGDKAGREDGRRAFARHLRALDPVQTVHAAGSLPRLAVPTQLVWGRHDRFQSWDEVGTRLRDVLPDPDVALLDDAGHFAPAEQPDAFARALLDWDPEPLTS